MLTNKSPLVTIVMNCFNGEKYLKEAIDSVYDQTYSNWEIVFWDNGSSDNSASIAKSYDKKLKYFYTKNTLPLGKVRNMALKKATGDYVAFLDCDDLYLPEKTKIQVLEMQTNNVVLSYGGWIMIDNFGSNLGQYSIKKYIGKMFEKLLSDYNVNFQTLMIDNNFLKQNNICFDENLKFSADHNLVMRIAIKDKIMCIDKTLAKYRKHNNSLSINKRNDKYEDYSYTINFLQQSGAVNDIDNFRNLAKKCLIKMQIEDTKTDRKFISLIILYCKFSILIIFSFFYSFK